MSLSDSQKLEVLEFFSMKGLNIKIMNKSFCPASVSFKHTAAWSREVTYLQRIEQPEWWKSACQSAHIYMSAYTISQAFPLHPWFYLTWTIKDYKWTVCVAFPPSSQPCAVSRTQAHPRHSLVSVCALWWGLFAGSAGLDLKLWCLKLVRSSVGGTLVCLGHGETQPGGSGCCSAVELAGPA